MKIPGFVGSVVLAPDPKWGSASGPLHINPRVVVSPYSVADVVATVDWARSEGRAITTRAAATGMPGGNIGQDVLLDMGPAGPFAQIGPIDTTLQQVTVGPGAIAALVDQAALAKGLTLPALPSSADRCTIGGMVANNAAGAHSFKHGAIANRVHAVTVVDAFGAVHRLRRERATEDPFAAAGQTAGAVESPARLRKNSSGYGIDRFQASGDAVDLLVGSEGTLGILVEVTLNLTKPARDHRTILVGAESNEALLEWTELARDLSLSACEFIGPWLIEHAGVRQDPVFVAVAKAAKHVLILEAEGSESVLDEAVRAIKSHAEKARAAVVCANTPEDRRLIWGLRKRASPAIAEAAGQGKRSMQFIEDSVVPPSTLGEYLAGVDALLDRAGFEAAVFGHGGDANIHINPLVPIRDADWLERVRTLLEETADLVTSLGGTLTGEHGDGRIRAPFLEQIWGPTAFSSFVTLKQTLDPKGIFNPGVIVPTPGQDPLLGLRSS